MSRLLTVLLFLCACGTTIRDVPVVDPYRIEFDGFRELSPRSTRLEVVDARGSTFRDHSEELVRAVAELVRKVLEREHLAVSTDSPFLLTVTIREGNDPTSRGIEPERCVTLDGRIERRPLFYAEAAGLGCHHLKHSFGFTVGGNISEAYTVALQLLLRTLDHQLQRVPREALSGT